MPTRIPTKIFAAFLIAFFLFAKPAAAQFGIPQVVVDPGANAQLGAAQANLTAQTAQATVQTTETVKQSAWQVLKISLTNTAALALLNGVNYFAQKVAYDAAVYLASGGSGQKPFFTTEGLGNYLQNTAADAAGEILGTLTTDPASFGKYGINLCVPKNPQLALNFKIGFLNGLPGILGSGGPTPPVPKCSWDSIDSNWTAFVNQDSSEVLDQIGVMFTPGESSLSAAIELNNVALQQIAEKNLESYGDYLANKGFKPVRDFISRDIKTPASTIENQLNTSLEQGWKQGDRTVAITGSAFGNAAFGILPAALQTFAGALSEQLLKKVFTQGLISVNDLLGSNSDQALQFGATSPQGGRASAELANASLLTPKILSITNYNELTDFATCPATGNTANHCVIDTQFYNAVSRADQGQAMTVRQAVQQGFLSRNWQLLPLAHRKNLEKTCYGEAFCYSNLVKLRLARVLPIGWEMAANSPFNDVNRPVTLGEAMDRFNDCPRDPDGNVDETRLPDPLHPWCHMIDPEWVLKYPSAICRQQAPGPTLLSPQSSARAESCVDVTTCIAQDASGNCTGGYGYCVREKSVWKLDADACPAQFSSCTVYNRADGASFSFLANTLDAGPCNLQNAGCRQYSLSSNSVPNGSFEDLLAGQPRDWTLSAGARLDRSGSWSSHGTNAVGVLAGNDASVRIPSLMAGKSYTLSAGAIQELEGTTFTGTVRISFFRADGSPVEASTLATTCQSENLGRAASFPIVATALGHQYGSCDVTTPPGTSSALLEISSTAPAAGNRTWFDALGVFGEGFSTSPYDGIFLNAQAATCAAGDAGCTEFVRLSSGTLNLVRNPGFEEANATTNRASYWTMDPARYENGTFVAYEGGSSVELSPTPVSQDVYGLLSDAVYSFSVKTRYPGTGTPPAATAAIQLYDTSPTPQPVSPVTVDGCTVSGSQMRVDLAVGDAYQGSNCSFTTPSNVGYARVVLTSVSPTDAVLADAVQLELSVGATPYHDAYASTAQRVNLKKAPVGLDCVGSDRSPECDKYAPSCRRDEVGCNAYRPVDGGTMITAVTTANDACPAVCAGYDTFRQEPTQFNAPRFPLFFIPSTAESCTASEAGCSEFTNIEKLAQGGESREYFTYLRLCTKPDDQAGTYYTWEGNDVRGYQLRSWSLRRANLASAIGPSDPTGGTAPCTKLGYDGAGQPRCADDAASVTEASCTKTDMSFNPDCREFYDVDGNIHYRLYSKTILSTDACREYRITKSTETECRDHGGRWQNNECRYLAYAPESLTCSASAKDCRAYSGNASRNVRVLVTHDFEDGTTNGWTAAPGGGSTTDVVNSNEAVSAGGHSLKATRADVTSNVSSRIRKGKSYILTFWAKGTGDLSARLSQAADASFTFNRTTSAEAPVALSTEWRPYQIGPVEAVRTAETNEQLVFQRIGGGAPLFFLDNIELREITDDVYLIEESWQTPIACDQTPSGASSPQYMLGCRAYDDRTNVRSTYKSFEKLCRPEVVGCEALYDTRNSASPFAQTFRAACTLAASCVPGAGLTCPCAVDGATVCQVTRGETSCRYDVDDDVPASRVSPDGDTVRISPDGVEYLVNDIRFRCDADAIGCTAMGDKRMNSARDAVDSWKTVYLRNVPSDYARTLCNAPEQYCQAYTRKSDAAPVFFKDPEARVCEFRDGAAAGSRGWFKKGTSEPCDPTYLEAGDRYGIWKNSDASYDGWAGVCSPQHDMCKEFIDPVATSPAFPNGTPYYAILNDRLATRTCQNRVSLNESPSGANTASACVLFWQTDNLTKTYSATATYALSDAQRGALVAPQSGGVQNDSNIIIRVQRDRQCGEWLDCRSSETVFNSTTGQYQNVCTSYSLCAEFERVGNTTRCVRYVESSYSGETLTAGVYSARTIGAKGMDYSGFAVPNRYSVDELVTVNVGPSATKPDLRLVHVSSACNGAYGTLCGPAGDQGSCLGPAGSRLCVHPIDGGRLITSEAQLNQPLIVSGYPGASCRAYPQESAPFPSGVADPNGWNYEAAELNNGNPVLISPSPAFAGANVCQRRLVNGVEVSSCECNYLIANYGSDKKYFPAGSSDIPSGYCTGGAYAGYECDPLASGARTLNNPSCCSKAANSSSGLLTSGCNDGGQCVRVSKVDRVVGYEGQCLERDLTRPINGTSDQYACLTWRPVGLIGGSRDIYNQNQSAGYFTAADRRFYCVGDQASWALTLNINTANDVNGDGVVDPRDQYTTNFFGTGKYNNRVENYASNSGNCSNDADNAGGTRWCLYPGLSALMQEDEADSSQRYRLTSDPIGILGCYEVSDPNSESIVAAPGVAEIVWPYIGPPLYQDQLENIYFQVTDDIYHFSAGVSGYYDSKPHASTTSQYKIVVPLDPDENTTECTQQYGAACRAAGYSATEYPDGNGIVTNPHQDIFGDCNDDGEDNIDNSDDDAGDSQPFTEADVVGGVTQARGLYYLNRANSWQVDASDNEGKIGFQARFDTNGLLKDIVLLAEADAGENGEGTFGINALGFTFKPGCERIAQIDQPGEFGATVAFTDVVNNARTFNGFQGQTDMTGQAWQHESACKPYGAVGAIALPPPNKPWTYVVARLATEAEQCTVLDFTRGARYQLDPPADFLDTDSLRRLFRKAFAVWDYMKLDFSAGGHTYTQRSNAVANPSDNGLTYYNEAGTVDPTTLMNRPVAGAIFGKVWYPPIVAAVDTGNCDNNGRCRVSRTNALTVNGSSQGILLGADGSLNVTAKFYAWASHNSMPILQRTVLWGDYTAKEPPAKGWYKNQKPFCSPDISDANAVGECSTNGLTCDTDADCPNSGTCGKNIGNHFGNTPGACNAGAFQFDHTYTCTLRDLQSMSVCTGPGDAAANAPCYRILDGTPTCVYRPKVQIVDNWGWCNCTGEGCAYTLSNNGAYREGCSLSNPPANAKPWTEYSGEIRLSPKSLHSLNAAAASTPETRPAQAFRRPATE